MSKKENRKGEKIMQNNGQFATIIGYRNNMDIDIMFEDGTYLYNRQYSTFKHGKIKNPYSKRIYGVGCIGNVNMKDTSGKRLSSYNVWVNMLSRCYNKNAKDYKNYGENGVIVCDEWLCYENFKKWYNDNIYEILGEKIELDKDILIKDNKIYSPETCIFIPQHINQLFSGHSKKNSLPKGVRFDKKNNKYVSQIRINGKLKYLGVYTSVEEAERVYLINRDLFIKELLEAYKYKIPLDLYEKLKTVLC